jgi:hypothetical protein
MKISWVIRLTFLVSALMGCATAEVISGPDGTPQQLISCADVRLCYEKASEVCGGKYQIVNTTNQPGVGNETSIKMLVKCQ